MMRIRRLLAALVLAVVFATIIGKAHAIEVECIEASKYKHLWRIFNGDTKKFSAYFMMDATKLPDPEFCRAALVTGSIVQKMDAEKLLDFILQNKGWLTTLYLASPGGSVSEGLRLGYLVRSFWLKTQVVSGGTVSYRPDFYVPELMLAPLPMQPPSMLEEFASARDWEAYLKIESGITVKVPYGACASACSYLYVAGIDRRGVAQLHRPRLPGKDMPVDISKSLSETEEALQMSEAAIVGFYREMDAGTNFINIFQSTPTRTVEPATDNRLPRYVADLLYAKCGTDIGHLQDVEAQLIVGMIELGSRNFGGSPVFGYWVNLDPMREAVFRVRERRRKAEQCTAAAHEQERLLTFNKQCSENCDRAKLIAATDDRVRRLRARSK